MINLEISKQALLNILRNHCTKYLQFKLLNLETSYDFLYMREKFDTFYQITAYQFEQRAIYDTQYTPLNSFMSKNAVFDGKDYVMRVLLEGILIEIKFVREGLVLDILDLPQQLVVQFNEEIENMGNTATTAMYLAFKKVAIMIDKFYNEYCATIPPNQLEAIKKINALEIKCQQDIFKIKKQPNH